LRRSDSIPNNCSAGSKIPNCGSAKPRIRALKAQPPRTEFLDAETGRQDSRQNARTPGETKIREMSGAEPHPRRCFLSKLAAMRRTAFESLEYDPIPGRMLDDIDDASSHQGPRQQWSNPSRVPESRIRKSLTKFLSSEWGCVGSPHQRHRARSGPGNACENRRSSSGTASLCPWHRETARQPAVRTLRCRLRKVTFCVRYDQQLRLRYGAQDYSTPW
jgi:hypothetical protein